MEKYTRLVSLFMELSLGESVEIPPEFLNLKFPVWSVPNRGNGDRTFVNAHVDGDRFLEQMELDGYRCHIYGDFSEPRPVDFDGDDYRNPMVIIGNAKPSNGGIELVESTFAELAAYCYRYRIGIGVVSNQVGFHFATSNYLESALEAVYKVVEEHTRDSFLHNAHKVELPPDVKDQLESFVNSFSSFLESIDYGVL